MEEQHQGMTGMHKVVLSSTVPPDLMDSTAVGQSSVNRMALSPRCQLTSQVPPSLPQQVLTMC